MGEPLIAADGPAERMPFLSVISRHQDCLARRSGAGRGVEQLPLFDCCIISSNRLGSGCDHLAHVAAERDPSRGARSDIGFGDAKGTGERAYLVIAAK